MVRSDTPSLSILHLNTLSNYNESVWYGNQILIEMELLIKARAMCWKDHRQLWLLSWMKPL